MDSFKKQLLIQLSVGLIILAAVTVGLFFFGGNIKDYSERIKIARQDLVSRSLSLSSLAALRIQYNTKGRDYLGFLQSYVPSRDQLINLSRDVQTLASGVSSFGFSFSGENEPTDGVLGVINFTANLRATIPQLISFLDNVGRFKYFMTVDNFSLTGVTDGGIFQVPVRGRVFFR